MFPLADIDRFLAEFDRDPAAFMAQIPDKGDPSGATVKWRDTAFTPADILTREFVNQKMAVRRLIRGVDGNGATVSPDDGAPGKARFASNDRAVDVVDELRYDRPADMDAQNLRSGQVSVLPWSGDFWPVYLGLLGRRYGDPSYPASPEWFINQNYVAMNPAVPIVLTGYQPAIDQLSPAEKYDILVGDPSMNLTQAMWREGQTYLAQKGKVERWMGICHGWAPASYMLPRPLHVVEARSPEGILLRFFPADIKALASLLWANAPPPMRFVGGRCDVKHPAHDNNGRVLSRDCFDTNPGTWHMAVVNQIGLAKRPLIIDTTYDYEVWNQPVVAYEYHYFNPLTRRAVATFQEAAVARSDLQTDRFAAYRARDTVTIAGVAMRVKYAVETIPDQKPTDDASRDVARTVDYQYDLELDAGGHIIGGEWYRDAHPDFLWTPSPSAHAQTAADGMISGSWRTGLPLPDVWRMAAPRASAAGLPLAHIVERLIALADN